MVNLQGTAGEAVAIATQSIPVFRILGHNPGPMTGPGTNSYLIVGEKTCLIDPGPADERQLDAILDAVGDNNLDYILVTHTHRDHSPGALRLQQATSAQLVGLAVPEAAGQDLTFHPSSYWQDGDVLDCGDYSIELIHTPGHVSNHLCFLLAEERLLFTGDHVLQGTTPVILPPDGNMAHYLGSLERLQKLDLLMLAPGHGDVMHEPQQEISKLIQHRLQREAKVFAGLEKLGKCDLDALVQVVYDDVAEHLIPWAKKTLLAHLYKLESEGRAVLSGEYWQPGTR